MATLRAQNLHHVLTSRQALTRVALSSQRVRPMVVTMAATTMIAHRALVVMLVTAATLAAAKTVVQRLLIVVVRTHALVLHALMRTHAPMRHHVRTKVVKNVVRSAVIVHTLALLRVTATAMIAQRVLSVIVIRVRSLIVHRVLTPIVVIVSNARLAHQRHAANTHHVHAPSARSHSSVQSALNTRHVQRVRSSMRPVHRVIANALQALQQRLPLTVAIVQHVVQPSRLNTLRQSRHKAANSRNDVARP